MKLNFTCNSSVEGLVYSKKERLLMFYTIAFENRTPGVSRTNKSQVGHIILVSFKLHCGWTVFNTFVDFVQANNCVRVSTCCSSLTLTSSMKSIYNSLKKEKKFSFDNEVDLDHV